MGSLERQVAWLTALEQIRRVIALYAKAGDDGNDPTLMATLMSADAVWQCADFGEFYGRDRIVSELARVARERIVWSLHYAVAPIIDVADDLKAAHAYWWLWELTTLRDAVGHDGGHWLGATYACDFVREPDAWKIKHLILDIRKIVPFSDGPPQDAGT